MSRSRPSPAGRRRATPPVVAAIAVLDAALKTAGAAELVKHALDLVGSPTRCARCRSEVYSLRLGRRAYLLERRLRRSPARGGFHLIVHRCGGPGSCEAGPST